MIEYCFTDIIQAQLYMNAECGGDRNNVNIKVQQALISMYLYLDLDELLAASPTAYQSFRNPVESIIVKPRFTGCCYDEERDESNYY